MEIKLQRGNQAYFASGGGELSSAVLGTGAASASSRLFAGRRVIAESSIESA